MKRDEPDKAAPDWQDASTSALQIRNGKDLLEPPAKSKTCVLRPQNGILGSCCLKLLRCSWWHILYNLLPNHRVIIAETYNKCGQSLQALFLFVFIRHPQIPSSVGVGGNGLECWCQRYHGWERNAYFRIPLSPCKACVFHWWVWVLLIWPLALGSNVTIIQFNNNWQPEGWDEWNSHWLARDSLILVVMLVYGCRRLFACKLQLGAPVCIKQIWPIG